MKLNKTQIAIAAALLHSIDVQRADGYALPLYICGTHKGYCRTVARAVTTERTEYAFMAACGAAESLEEISRAHIKTPRV